MFEDEYANEDVRIERAEELKGYLGIGIVLIYFGYYFLFIFHVLAGCGAMLVDDDDPDDADLNREHFAPYLFEGFGYNKFEGLLRERRNKSLRYLVES